MTSKNLYERLGVSKTASDSDIKKAYRTLSMKHHPERTPGKETNEKMNEINGAYDILKDQDSRKKYDLEQQM